MKAAQWIDRVKQAKGWDSDYRVAKSLGFKGNTISMYRAHGGTMDDTICMKVAQALEIDPALVLTDQAMERSKDAETRSAWSAVLDRLGGVAAGVLVAVGVSPTLLNDVAGLCALCKPETASKSTRRRPVMSAMARTLSAAR
jgi:hypothetical protein